MVLLGGASPEETLWAWHGQPLQCAARLTARLGVVAKGLVASGNAGACCGWPMAMEAVAVAGAWRGAIPPAAPKRQGLCPLASTGAPSPPNAVPEAAVFTTSRVPAERVVAA